MSQLGRHIVSLRHCPSRAFTVNFDGSSTQQFIARPQPRFTNHASPGRFRSQSRPCPPAPGVRPRNETWPPHSGLVAISDSQERHVRRSGGGREATGQPHLRRGPPPRALARPRPALYPVCRVGPLFRGTPPPNRRPPPSSLRSSAIWASPRQPRTEANTRPAESTVARTTQLGVFPRARWIGLAPSPS